MKRLQLKNANKVSLTNGTKQELGKLEFDLNQFKIPKKFVLLKNEVVIKIDKEKNKTGELVEAGTHTVTFKVYDRSLVEIAMQNELTEYGSPIDVVIEKVADIPNFDNYSEVDFVPIKFEGLTVKPLKVQRKVYANGQSIDSWQFADLRVSVTGYKVEE
jgi:hypothetical protein